MDKIIVMNEIDMIIERYCRGCFLKSQLVKDSGKTAAHRFCISGCTVGERLKSLGDQMNKFTK